MTLEQIAKILAKHGAYGSSVELAACEEIVRRVENDVLAANRRAETIDEKGTALMDLAREIRRARRARGAP